MSHPADEPEHRIFAWSYDRLTQVAERRWLGALRDRLVGDLTGRILEIGAGTGANLPHYRRAESVIAAEPDRAMRARLSRRLTDASVPIRLSSAGAGDLPEDDASFDAVVSTLVLCTVPELDRALAEIRRVLKPTGRLVFCEHVRGTGFRGRVQDLVTPLWTRMAAGCHPNRDIAAAIEHAGLTIDDIETCSPRPDLPILTPIIHGTARP